MNHCNTWQTVCQATMQIMTARVLRTWAPPPKLTTTQWADKFRYLAAESSALPGKYSSKLTPWVPGMHAALDDSQIYEVVCMKSAQIAWTDGVLNNWIGRILDIDPSPIIGLFPKTDAAKEYSQEKLAPMVTATPRLRGKVDVETSRKDGNRALFKKFAGGWLKLVGSNSPSNVKSSPAPRVFVEEPDDASTNVGKQGDSIKLLEERTKTYHRRKIVKGGTPSIKGLSAIEDAHKRSDQRRFFVPCHDCGEAHALTWDNVTWRSDDAVSHEVYGHALPASAAYVCPHCGSIWSDQQKNKNVRKGEWRATATSAGVAGFHINELYSPFPGSRLSRLVERYLEAQHKLEQGDDTDMIVFVNSALGLPYEYASSAPKADELDARAEDYVELIAPHGVLAITAGIDVQHDRLAVVLRGWGRDEESWLMYWGELHAKTSVVDINDPVWKELDNLLFTPKASAAGYRLIVSSISIDASDGQTSDAVYHYVRSRQRRGVMAVKGSSNDYGTREIYSAPKKADYKNKTKASKYGLQVYIVGTHKAKDLIIGDRGRITLTGNGAGRMHWYKDVRGDYYEQLTSEVRAPHRGLRGKMVWQKKAGVRNEAIDCEVMALHAARAVKLHIRPPAWWDDLEQKMKQSDLFGNQEAEAPAQPQQNQSAPMPRKNFAKNYQKY